MTAARKTLLAATLCLLAFSTAGHAQTASQETANAPFTPMLGQEGKDVIWVPTPQELVDLMLDMAELKPDDTLVDLGSGDGRTVISAAQRGIRAHGIEYNPDMVALSNSAAHTAGVADRVSFKQADIFESDFSSASVVTLFLLPNLNVKLRPTLLAMKPGTRVISNAFTMGDWEPDEVGETSKNCASYCKAYKWVIPANVQGTWTLNNGTLTLNQTYQKLDGTLNDGKTEHEVQEGRVLGTQVTFRANNQNYSATLNGSTLQGFLNGTTPFIATRAGTQR